MRVYVFHIISKFRVLNHVKPTKMWRKCLRAFSQNCNCY